MEKERAKSPHILVIPIPVQGHINPMLQFSKRLAAKGLTVTFVVASSSNGEAPRAEPGSIRFEPISEEARGSEKLETMLEWFQAAAAKKLPELIAREEALACVVYDSGMPWVLGWAKEAGILGASFFTHSCGVACVYYNLNRGLLKTPLDRPRVSLPGLPVLEPHDLPSFVSDPESYPSMLKLVVSRFSNVADWIFFSSFESLESEVVSWMRTKLPIKPIGPTLPSMYLDKRLDHDNHYGFETFKPDTNSCTKWLDSKPEGSVAYVSFGSLANLKSEQTTELVEGLRRTDCNILWVVREPESLKLPEQLSRESSGKWLIVSWCPQLQVLGHKSVGCFVSHCGWNSTMEALSLGVPMVALPQWTDQLTNAKFVADVWRVGVRGRAGEGGVVGREEIENCVREVVSGERGRGMRERALGWKKLAKEALSPGGTSDRSINEFVAELTGKNAALIQPFAEK